MIKILCDCIETYARINFLRDVAAGCFDEDNINKWEQLNEDDRKMYLKEANETIEQYVLTLDEIKAIEKLI